MTKKFLLSTLFIFLLFSFVSAQYKEEINTIRKQFSEISKGIAYTEETPLLADDNCRVTVNVKKKNDEIRMIELIRMEETRSYTYQYYFWNNELFFVYTRNDINEGENDNGVVTFRVYEYRHYFSGMQCIKSLYRGFRYTDKEPAVKNIDFYDYSKAYDEMTRGNQLLEYGTANQWKKVCQMVIPI